MGRKIWLIIIDITILLSMIFLIFRLTLDRLNHVSENKVTISTIDQQKTKYKPGALVIAVNEHDLKKVKLIINDSEYKIDELDSNQNTPLNLAVHNDDIEISKVLINNGADINIQNNIKDSPYLYAGAEGRTEILREMLKKAQPDLSKHNRFGGNALIPAAEKGHIENVKMLLEHGQEDINYQNVFGYTALIEVVALRESNQVYKDIIKILLEYGADQTLRDNSGKTALDYVIQKNDIELIKLLRRYS